MNFFCSKNLFNLIHQESVIKVDYIVRWTTELELYSLWQECNT